jgi:hypothetical protein
MLEMFQCVRSRIDWIVGLVVPTSFEIWPVAQLGMELHQPQDRRRAVLPLRKRRVTRAAALFLADGGGIELQLQLVDRIGLGLVDLFLGQLVVHDRVETLHTGGHVAIRDALHFQLMQAAEIADLLEADRGVVDEPDRGGLCHDRFVHVGRLLATGCTRTGPLGRLRG